MFKNTYSGPNTCHTQFYLLFLMTREGGNGFTLYLGTVGF